MIRQDYILRQIARLSELVEGILGLRLVDKNKAQAAIQQACLELLSLDGQLLVSLSGESLRQLLGIDEGRAAVKCVIAADLLMEQAALFDSLGRSPEAETCRANAMELYRGVPLLPGGKECLEKSIHFLTLSQNPGPKSV